MVNIFLHCTPFLNSFSSDKKIYLATLNQPLPDADLIMAWSHNFISFEMEEPQIIHHDVMTLISFILLTMADGKQSDTQDYSRAIISSWNDYNSQFKYIWTHLEIVLKIKNLYPTSFQQVYWPLSCPLYFPLLFHLLTLALGRKDVGFWSFRN